MSESINQSKESLQGQSEEVERFSLFRFQCSLGKGIKNHIKSYGCQWNSIFHGWICPLAKQKEVENIIEEAKLNCDISTVPLPKGMIPNNPKILGKESHLDILEKEVYKEGTQLLKDIFRYNASLRPEDFAKPQTEDEKTTIQIQIENDFHQRFITLEKKKDEVERTRIELTHLISDPGEKILSHDAPLLIVDSLIQRHFLYQESRTLQHCSDSFWRWNGVQYVELDENEIRQIIYIFLRDAKQLNTAGYLENFNPTKYKVDQVIDALRAICYQKHHPSSGAFWLDGREAPDPKYLVSFQNGLLSIKDWLKNPTTTLIPHTPFFMNVNSLTFSFDSNVPEPKTWLNFLDTIWNNDQESKETLQEWFGYVLTQNTRLQKILLIIGPPRSGKGTIGRVQRELLGHFNVAGPTLSSLGGEFGLQPLLNQMLALISDARLNAKGGNSIIIERLLSISGEDPLTINRKFLPSITTQLPTRIMMMSNELPDMKDPSGALAKRYLVLTLKTSWLGKEDISLFDRLKEELPGILLWSLQGLIRLEQRGFFLQPKSSLETIDELEAMTSPIKAFILERCTIKPQTTVLVQVLFNHWRNWCLDTGYPNPGNIQSFGKNLKAAFPAIGITRPQGEQTRERYYVGIDIANP